MVRLEEKRISIRKGKCFLKTLPQEKYMTYQPRRKWIFKRGSSERYYWSRFQYLNQGELQIRIPVRWLSKRFLGRQWTESERGVKWWSRDNSDNRVAARSLEVVPAATMALKGIGSMSQVSSKTCEFTLSNKEGTMHLALNSRVVEDVRRKLWLGRPDLKRYRIWIDYATDRFKINQKCLPVP